MRKHNQCTYDLIKGMDIFGLRQSEVTEIAFVAGSISESFSPEENLDFSLLSDEEQLIISKLAAIFRLANALDKSHGGKFHDLRVSLEEDRVLFRAETSESNHLLEKWSFREAAGYFQKVFGLSPELTVKFELL